MSRSWDILLSTNKTLAPNFKIVWSPDWQEYIVKNKSNPAANYHTNDLQDALGTAQAMKREYDAFMALPPVGGAQ